MVNAYLNGNNIFNMVNAYLNGNNIFNMVNAYLNGNKKILWFLCSVI